MAEIVYELSRLRFPMIGQLRNTKTDPNRVEVTDCVTPRGEFIDPFSTSKD